MIRRKPFSIHKRNNNLTCQITDVKFDMVTNLTLETVRKKNTIHSK